MVTLWNLGRVRDFLRMVRRWIPIRRCRRGKGATPPRDVRGVQLALTENGFSFSFPTPSYNLPRSRAASTREAALRSTSCLCRFLTLEWSGSIAVPFSPTSRVAPLFLPLSRLPFPFLCRALQPQARGVSL